VSVSCCNSRDVCDERYETPKVVAEEGIPEEVDKSVAGVEVQVVGCSADNECDVCSRIVIPTPARVSCNVTSVHYEETKVGLHSRERRHWTQPRGEETEIVRFHLEPRRETIPPFAEVRDCDGDYIRHREEEDVGQFQEMADLKPCRTRSRGVQDVTADKSEVSPATLGPRDSGRVEPSVSHTTSPIAFVVLVTFWQIFPSVRNGTAFPAGVSRDIPDWIVNCIATKKLFVLLSICNIVPGQFTIFVCVLLIVITCLYTEFNIISVTTCLIYLLCIRFICIC